MKVMLNGQGADEQLAGYTGFYIVMVADRLRKGQFVKFLKEWRVYKRNRAVTEQYISSYEILLPALASLIVPKKCRYMLQMLFYRSLYVMVLRRCYVMRTEIPWRIRLNPEFPFWIVIL